jgi:protein tyrosine/serine phosphatase
VNFNLRTDSWLLIAVTLFISCIPLRAGAIDRFSQVTPGIWRGAQPENDLDYGLLKTTGIKTIIDLRDDQFAQEKPEAAKRGMNDLSFPMDSVVYPDEPTVVNALNALADVRNQPAFIHCEFGKDRTGLIVALYRIHQLGWTANDAHNEMMSHDFSPLEIFLDQFFWDHSQPGQLRGLIIPPIRSRSIN